MEVSNNTHSANDVPEHLNDLIPYRCPKCGHKRRFATLRELRLHLQNDHSFQMGFIKPHSRTTIFNKDTNSSKNVSSDSNLQVAANVSPKHNEYLVEERDHAFMRESSPLLRSFKDEANELEMELQRAKQNEMRNKAISMRNISNNRASHDFQTDVNNDMNTHNVLHKTNVAVSRPSHMSTSQPMIMKQLPDMNMKSTLDKLNAEVMKSRLDQWVTSDALYKSQDILLNMEEAADANVREQQGIVKQLMHDIKLKGDRIDLREREHRELRDERQRLYRETEHLVKEANSYNQDLKHELHQRSEALDNLASDMKRLQNVSEKQLKSKENDLQIAREKMQRLEWERDRLIEETEGILQRADTDNIELRNTIKAKENELVVVNDELTRLRHSNHNLLEKATEIQTRADESKALMQSVLNAKNTQLESTIRQLHEMKALQAQLVEESKILTEQADDNTHSMKQMLINKEERVRQLTVELGKLREEKYRLEESSSSLEEKAARSLNVIDSLKDVVKTKEKDLQTTQGELADLKDFLQSAAAKERGARKKLEKFIDELIHRAEKAEAELRTLRSQSSHSIDSPKQDETDVKHKQTNDTTRDGETVGSQQTPSHKQDMNEFSDNSERLGLPTRLTPQKPPRTRLRSPGPDITSNIHNNGQGGNLTHIPKPPHDTKRHSTVIQTEAQVHVPEVNKNMGHILSNENSPKQRQSAYAPHSEISLEKKSNNKVLPRPSVDRDDNSQTLNTDSLIRYLNEGLLNSIDKQKTDNRIRFHADYMPDQESRNYDHKPTYRRSDNIPAELHVDGNHMYRQASNVPERASHVSRYYDTYRNTNYRDVSDDLHEPYGVVQSDRRDRYMQRDTDVDGYLSRLKHGRLYDTLTNRGQDRQRIRRDSYGDRPVPPRRNQEEFTRSKLLQSLSKSADKRRYYDASKACPVDRSPRPQQYNIARRIANIEKRKRDGLKKKGKLKQFDSTYPERHTSLHDLRRKSQWKDPDKRQDSNRRSRSLSPEVKVRKTSRSRTRQKKERSSPRQPTPDRHSNREVVESDNSEKDSQEYALLQESLDDNSQGFVGMMDENGILWASHESNVQGNDSVTGTDNGSVTGEEADTLPDISDSELDRVSPSGSEAIATKKTNQTVAVVPRTNKYDKNSKTTPRVSARSQRSDNDHSTSMTNATSYRKHSASSSVTQKTNNVAQVPNHERGSQDDKLKRKRIIQVSKNDSEHIANKDVLFRPIKAAADLSKRSSSDKELTSGAREVRNYVNKSPEIRAKGSHSSATERHSRQSGEHSSGYKKDNDLKETLEEKLKRISDKYKSQRVVIGSSKDDSHKGATGVGTKIDDKVKLINEKYKAKRQAIVESKGVGGLKNEDYAEDNQDNTLVKRSVSAINVGQLQSHGMHDIPQRFGSVDPIIRSSILASNPYRNIQGLRNSENHDGSLPRDVAAPLIRQVDPNSAVVNPVSHQFPLLPHGAAYQQQMMPYGHYNYGVNSPVGQIYGPYPPYYPNAVPNTHVQNNAQFPHIYPYFHPSSHPGLQQMSQTNTANPDNSEGRTNGVKEAEMTAAPNQTENNQQVSQTLTQIKTPDLHACSGDTTSEQEVAYMNKRFSQGNTPVVINKEYSPLMKESDVETEKVPQSKLSDDIDQIKTPITEGTDVALKTSDARLSSTKSPIEKSVSPALQSSIEEEILIQRSNNLDFGVEHPNAPDIKDSPVQSVETSMFAAPIDDDYSATCNSNTQSMIDLQGSGVETDLDTDTESVKRDFFEKAHKIRGMLGEMHDDDLDSLSQRSYRNAMSSASSQG